MWFALTSQSELRLLGVAAMKKTVNEWKTRDLKAATSHFQHAFIDKTARQTSIPFSLPHLITLRNQGMIFLCVLLKYDCLLLGGAYSSVERHCDYTSNLWASSTAFIRCSKSFRDLQDRCVIATRCTASDGAAKSSKNHNSKKAKSESTRKVASPLATITW